MHATNAPHENDGRPPKEVSNLNLAWPARSYERRRVFQELFQMFYQQVLYGCKDPACNTPTCASSRIRRSKGPFRPYTVSTARAVAIHLVSVDHPSKKICPNIKASRAPKVNYPSGQKFQTTPSDNPPLALDKEKEGSNTRDSEQLKSRSVGGSGKAQESARPIDEARQDGRELADATISRQSQESRLQDASSGPQERMETLHDDGTGKCGKNDTKSLTQNMCETLTMHLLQMTEIPQLGHKFASREDETKIKANIIDPKPAMQMASDVVETLLRMAQGFLVSVSDSFLIFGTRLSSSSSRKTTISAEHKDVPAHESSTQNDSSNEIVVNEASARSKFIVPLNLLSLHHNFGLCRSGAYRHQPRLFALPRPRFCQPCLRMKPLPPIYSFFLRSEMSVIETSATPPLKSSALIKVAHDLGSTLGQRKLLGRTDRPVPLLWCGAAHHDAVVYGAAEAAQSLSSLLDSAEGLLRCFLRENPQGKVSLELWSNDFVKIVEIFRRLHGLDLHPPAIFAHLWQVAGCIYPSHTVRSSQHGPPEYKLGQSTQSSESRNVVGLADAEIAHLTKSMLGALAGSAARFSCHPDQEAWLAVQKLRQCGQIALPMDYLQSKIPSVTITKTLALLDCLDDDMGHSLIKRLCIGLACRRHKALPVEGGFEQDIQAQSPGSTDHIDLVVRSLRDGEAISLVRPLEPGNLPFKDFSDATDGQILTHSSLRSQVTQDLSLEFVIEWLRGVVLKEWNGEVSVPKCSAVGGALEILSSLYNHYGKRLLDPEVFEISFLSERMDLLEAPKGWIRFKQSSESDTKFHLVDFPFLFRPAILVSYFRAINHAKMTQAYRDSISNGRLASKLTFCTFPSDLASRGQLRLEDRLSRLTNPYLVLSIRREEILNDAFNQLWRRQRSELLRPLKVLLGRDEGEWGTDQGGVQQEFVRIAVAEALDPKYGAFTTDSVTHMTWFQPGSLEPLYKFELLGIMMSLAIYNGLTLPVTFPIALYMKLLNHEPDCLTDIEDGWPDLARGLRALRDCADEDVEDVFCRSYTFSVDVFGITESVDMNPESNSLSSHQPLPCSPMVTNANRHQYIQDYIHQLTSVSVAPQYDAFAKGFKTVIDPRSLSLFTPSTLQTLVQGLPRIDTRSLEAVARYEDGYDAGHPAIRMFWSIVHEWASCTTTEPETSTGSAVLLQDRVDAEEAGQIEVRQLLEFVTASDRLPVGGEARIMFIVQKHGSEDQRWPSSMTCFGRLLLPEYSSREIMKRRLEQALEHAKGFGQV